MKVLRYLFYGYRPKRRKSKRLKLYFSFSTDMGVFHGSIAISEQERQRLISSGISRGSVYVIDEDKNKKRNTNT